MGRHERMGKLLSIVNRLYCCDDGVWFRDPVNWEELGLTDYPLVIKQPMDLGTIAKRLSENFYATPEACAADVRLVWENCMAYNEEGSSLYQIAEALYQRFEEHYIKIVPSDFNMKRMPMADERVRLSRDIYRIRSEQLREIVKLIQVNCPKIIEKRNAHALVINLDALPPPHYWQVEVYVRKCLSLEPLERKKRQIHTASISTLPKQSIMQRQKQLGP
ncbi:unnamed protein product [Chrysoparadoxa australica]